MNPLTLAQEIIDGRRITREDDLSFFLTCDLDELCEGANRIRKACIGDKVDLCSIINGRSGRCPEDCKYCAQSAHHHTSCEVYDFLPEEKILEACKMNEREGVDRFSIVTAGKVLTGEEFEKAIHAYETMKKECRIDLCASMGFLTREQLHRLHEAGVSSYHHNIETSKRYFPQICTTHTYEQKIATLKMVKEEGMYVCSGGIIGMGETWEDRIDMAVSLFECGVDSIPINSLMPIKGTPLENLERISEPDILRTVALFRYINPTADIRLGAGRALLTNDGELAFESGVSATITGNMLTTVACATIRSDKKMLEGIDVLTSTSFEDYKAAHDISDMRIVYTGNIDEYFGYKYGALQYRTVRFETEYMPDVDNYQGNAVVNYTEREVPYTRVIEHRHFEKCDAKGTVVSKEFSSEWSVGIEPYYPINNDENNALYQKYEQLALQEKNVIFVGWKWPGRWGECFIG